MINNLFIQKLKVEDFAAIESFFSRESSRYELNIDRPVHITLGPEVIETPPVPPLGRSALRSIFLEF